MAIKRIDVGTRMSEAVVHNGTVYLSGSAADSMDANITVQTQETLAYIDQMLAKAGSDKSKLLSAVIWIKSFKDFAAMNAVWDKWVDPKNPPVRACVHSAELFDDRCLVEIKVIAATREGRSAPRRVARRPASARRAPAKKAKKAKRR
jgi:enamine deaminase RidA (YjgF/YER057c/UK114 family)